VTSHASSAPAASASLHADGIAAFQAGDGATAAALLSRAALRAVDATVLNDLAVVLQSAGEVEHARALLLTCLTLDQDNADAQANLAELDGANAPDLDSWRRSNTLGGSDPVVPERAYPGMHLVETLSEHAMRYSLALGVLPGRHFLDVGCGTGYGTEMLTWRADSVRGFDLWEPDEHERPRWSGGAELTYGFDVCKDPLPGADAAVMFEVVEHLHDAPAALRNVFRAVNTLLASFPNPKFHGSHLNPHHVNDWSLEQFESELRRAAAPCFGELELVHWNQPHGSPAPVAGRDPESPFWVVCAKGEGKPVTQAQGVETARRLRLPR
jgi:SAM-dependent methyltransferase